MKTLLVCGYGSGISDAVVRRFAADGYAVGIAARNADKLAAARRAFKEKGIDVDPFSFRGADADEIVAALANLEIDIGNEGEKVRIYAVDEDDDGREDDEGDQHLQEGEAARAPSTAPATAIHKRTAAV